MACTSACAVGSFDAVTSFRPVPIILPSLTTMAPNGPPWLDMTFSKATSIAFSIKEKPFIQPLLGSHHVFMFINTTMQTEVNVLHRVNFIVLDHMANIT